MVGAASPAKTSTLPQKHRNARHLRTAKQAAKQSPSPSAPPLSVRGTPKGGTMTTPLEEAVERVRKLVSCFDKFVDGHRMLGDSLLLGDLRTILNALSIDEERVASMRNTIILILDANYHTAISKAQSTADQIVQSIVGEGL
jgi:hypothetical protein